MGITVALCFDYTATTTTAIDYYGRNKELDFSQIDFHITRKFNVAFLILNSRSLDAVVTQILCDTNFMKLELHIKFEFFKL